MATNLALDDRLIEAARHLGGHRTKKAAVETALRDYIQRKEQAKLIDLFGTVDFDPSYDAKAERSRRGGA